MSRLSAPNPRAKDGTTSTASQYLSDYLSNDTLSLRQVRVLEFHRGYLTASEAVWKNYKFCSHFACLASYWD
jgi:hypothetical protein